MSNSGSSDTIRSKESRSRSLRFESKAVTKSALRFLVPIWQGSLFMKLFGAVSGGSSFERNSRFRQRHLERGFPRLTGSKVLAIGQLSPPFSLGELRPKLKPRFVVFQWIFLFSHPGRRHARNRQRPCIRQTWLFKEALQIILHRIHRSVLVHMEG